MIREQIYLAGDMLNLGSQMQRAKEKEALLDLGYKLYVPQDNKDINDKANLDSNDGLAEKIVKADTQGIIESQIVVMEAREGALGTCIELGQIKGMKDMAKMVLAHMENVHCCTALNGGEFEKIRTLCTEMLYKEVYIHNSDIRRTGNPTETGDRRSYGPHQYMYGVVRDVAGDYAEFEDILEILNA